MYQLQKTKNKIYSTGVYLPEKIVKSVELFEEIHSDLNYGMSTNWMTEKMGIDERRVAPSGALPSDLAIPAARMALEDLTGFDSQVIDLVVFCGIERDQPEPATAHIIQHKLGLKARYAFDMANACFGFIDAMQIADTYISNGIARYALIVTGEIPSRVLRAAVDVLKKGVDIKTARNIIGALSVGDAGGAVIIGPVEKGDNSGFELFNTNTYSNLADKCMYKKGDDGSIDGHMSMAHLSKAFIDCHSSLVDATLDTLGWSEFDWMLSHQVGQKPFDRISKLNGVSPDKMVKTLDKLGNITSATFPVNFKKLKDGGLAKQGDRVGGCFAGSGIVIGQLGYTF